MEGRGNPDDDVIYFCQNSCFSRRHLILWFFYLRVITHREACIFLASVDVCATNCNVIKFFTVSWEIEDAIKQAGRHIDNGWRKWKQVAMVITSFYELGGGLKVSSGETMTNMSWQRNKGWTNELSSHIKVHTRVRRVWKNIISLGSSVPHHKHWESDDHVVLFRQWQLIVSMCQSSQNRESDFKVEMKVKLFVDYHMTQTFRNISQKLYGLLHFIASL